MSVASIKRQERVAAASFSRSVYRVSLSVCQGVNADELTHNFSANRSLVLGILFAVSRDTIAAAHHTSDIERRKRSLEPNDA